MMSRQLQVYAVISRNHPQLKAIQGGLIWRSWETVYDTYKGNINENVRYKK